MGLRNMNLIQYIMKTKLCPLYLVASPKGLEGIFFDEQDAPMINKLNPISLAEIFLIDAVKQLEEYFSGKRRTFNLEFNFVGTSFQKKVWQALIKIPFGQTVSYKEIAKRIHHPKAVRAVGTANGANPFCIVVPCHRVISSDGSMGGFGGGIALKEKLLELERSYLSLR